MTFDVLLLAALIAIHSMNLSYIVALWRSGALALWRT